MPRYKEKSDLTVLDNLGKLFDKLDNFDGSHTLKIDATAYTDYIEKLLREYEKLGSSETIDWDKLGLDWVAIATATLKVLCPWDTENMKKSIGQIQAPIDAVDDTDGLEFCVRFDDSTVGKITGYTIPSSAYKYVGIDMDKLDQHGKYLESKWPKDRQRFKLDGSKRLKRREGLYASYARWAIMKNDGRDYGKGYSAYRSSISGAGGDFLKAWQEANKNIIMNMFKGIN